MAQEQAGAGMTDNGSGIYDGFKGLQEIRTDPATVTGVGYVHPVQADVGALGGDFVAVGTAKGVGVANCANDYDPKWNVYGDWVIGGVYNCIDFALDKYGALNTPVFQIDYAWCASAGATRWRLNFGGTVYTCLNTGSTSAAGLYAFLETTGTGTADRNIDVEYRQLKKKYVGTTTWHNLGDTRPYQVVDPNYTYVYISNTAFRAYLAPFN
jgi:hypothetical protein